MEVTALVTDEYTDDDSKDGELEIVVLTQRGSVTGGTKLVDKEYEEMCKVGNADETMVELSSYDDAVLTEIDVIKVLLESISKLDCASDE